MSCHVHTCKNRISVIYPIDLCKKHNHILSSVSGHHYKTMWLSQLCKFVDMVDVTYRNIKKI